MCVGGGGGGRCVYTVYTHAVPPVVGLQAQVSVIPTVDLPTGWTPGAAHELYLQLLSASFSGYMSDVEYQELSREVARAYVSDCGGLSGEYTPERVEAIRR